MIDRNRAFESRRSAALASTCASRLWFAWRSVSAPCRWRRALRAMSQKIQARNPKAADREGNRDKLKTAHGGLVHLHAVGQQTVLCRAHRLQRAACAVHACPLCVGIRWNSGASGLRCLGHRTKCGEHARRVLAKLRHPRLLTRIVSCQRRQPTDVGVDSARSLTERREIPARRPTTECSGQRCPRPRSSQARSRSRSAPLACERPVRWRLEIAGWFGGRPTPRTRPR